MGGAGKAAEVTLDGEGLTLDEVVAVARHGVPVRIAPAAADRMARSHAWVLEAASGAILDARGEPIAVYGVNTGYGSLARVRIDADKIRELSWNLIRSHAAGVGPPMDTEAVRAMMVLRANALAKGASGCQPILVQRVVDMLNAGVTPRVPSRGSCGSSGDLAPLAHLGLVLFQGGTDESGIAMHDGVESSGAEAMARAGLERVVPGPKDGLAIINGAQLTCGVAALTVHDAAMLVRDAEIALAMSFEALRGVTRALHPDVHRLRPFPGAIAVAADLRTLLAGSTLADSRPDRVQDAYSIRCAPQVMGACRDAIRYAAGQIRIELNSVTDNPVILLDEPDVNKAFSAGLFHGEPLGFAADHLKLALCELAAVAERRVYRLTTGALSGRLPPLLAQIDSPRLGLMMPQTVAASLVSANKQLAWPSSADSIPTCEDQEDHVAMATTAARRAADVLSRTRTVVAIEVLTAAHALWWRLDHEQGVRLGRGTAKALEAVEAELGGRRGPVPADDIARLDRMIARGDLWRAVKAEVGPLPGVVDG